MQCELRFDTGGGPEKLYGRRQPQARAIRLEGGAPLVHVELVLSTRVIEGRKTLELEGKRSADDPHLPDDVVVDLVVPRLLQDRHEVHALADAVLAKEARQEDVCIRQVHLLRDSGRTRRDPEVAASLRVKNRGEHAGRIEVREATPIDRTVRAYQGDAVKIADHSVILDRHVAPIVESAGMELAASGSAHHHLPSSLEARV